MKTRRLLVLVYDGIANSVFESLVLTPAEKKLKTGLFSHVDVVSFETDYDGAVERGQKYMSQYPGISIQVFRRFSVLGAFSVSVLAPVLARWLIDTWYDEILVRGPLAAYVLRSAISWFVLPIKPNWIVPISLQIRGLAAEELRFSYHVDSRSGFLKKILFLLRFNTLQSIEKSVYKPNFWSVPIQVYVVTSALLDYVVQQWDVDASCMQVEKTDLLEPISLAVRLEWRHEIRDYLKIPQDAVVYGYSGSCKKWQCAQETVEFMIVKIKENPLAYGIILTTDVLAFQKIIEGFSCDRSRLLLHFVQPKEVLRWTAAFDYGILLRYQDIVNWVARPTKALEYISVGVQIIHNNTVRWLIDYEKSLGAGSKEITPQPRQLSSS